MNVEFINGAGMRCEFTDDGIICRIGSNNTLFPYGSIETIRWYWGSIDIAGGGKTFTFVPYGKDKSKAKEMIAFAEKRMKTDPPAKPINLNLQAQNSNATKITTTRKFEHRMRCNVCGKVFCYTDADLAENESHMKMAAAHATGSLMNALFGSQYLRVEEDKKMEAEKSKIVDYSRCPSCNSTSIAEIADEKEVAVVSTTSSVISAADELKKFKELLDLGIVTQEEFDAKKRQLLGL